MFVDLWCLVSLLRSGLDPVPWISGTLLRAGAHAVGGSCHLPFVVADENHLDP